jgi:hypothetical protein
LGAVASHRAALTVFIAEHQSIRPGSARICGTGSEGDVMETRTTGRTVEFHRPFVLKSLDGEQPAGIYVVSSVEELLDTFTVTAWKRIATTIRLSQDNAIEYATIDPVELDDALANDAALDRGDVVKPARSALTRDRPSVNSASARF